MREHHPMRYNRMTEILKSVAQIKPSFSSIDCYLEYCHVMKSHKAVVFCLSSQELLHEISSQGRVNYNLD